MDFDLLYPSRFVKAADLGGKDVTKTIRAVKVEELGEGDQKKGKVVVTFDDSKKQWVMPRTCGEALKLMFGRETNAWIGKRVTLFSKMVDSFGDEVPAVRVRGSPDISKRLTADVQRGRKTIKVDVIPTGGAKTGMAEAPSMSDADDEAYRQALVEKRE